MAIDLAEFLRTYATSGVGYEAEPATEAGLVNQLVSREKSVLDLGGGEAGRSLAARGCSVQTVSLAELESASLESIAGGNSYDVVLLSDTLGSVREPERLLHQCRSLLKADGFIVASVTNFGYGGLRLAMLAGTFEQLAYDQELTPRKHFFSAPLLNDVFTRAGYRTESILRLSAPWEHDANGPEAAKIDETVVRQLKRDPENTTLMFVVKAAPVLRAVPQHEAEALQVLKREAEELRAEITATNVLIEELRAAGRALQQQNNDLRRQPAENAKTLRALGEAMREAADATAARDQFVARVHTMDAEMGELRARLAAHTRESAAQLRALREQNEQIQAQKAEALKHADERAAALGKRAADAEKRATEAESRAVEAENRARTAEHQLLEQTNGLLESTQSEIQKLSDLVNIVQTSRFWKLKALVAKLGRRRSQIG